MGDCVICGETVTERDAAEMYNAEAHDPETGDCTEGQFGIVHPDCGLSRGWQVS